ncbi:TetR/AcrR family transcriptional regulator [Lactiplantibacillus plantarum]|uniref:TetR/AcrR family transcriptional regulator n=1 Tax=Lactiplantibacillus plantarum TaxID=1590 RepID=UPI00298CE183|nr:TetR/AcrR family transcriptional regulator [Lactiplantibacillus plantarum]WPB53449.1 TetR/AcrR family transcriptional regulator [Lactiplantibacillus plantarum]
MDPQTRKRQNLTAVYAALLQLMSQKPLSRISITELCQHAQVSRTYFYRNFANFDQIILAYQKQTILQYLRQLPRQSKVKLTAYFSGAVINMLVHWQQNGMVETPAYLAQQVTRFTLRDNESRS